MKNLQNATPQQMSELEKLPKDETLRLRKQHIGASVTLFFKKAPLKIVKGQGQYMYDECGNAYLDCINNVAHVGHCHPEVVKAGCEQMALLSTNARYLHDNLVLYAKRLTDYFPKKLTVCYFVNSGSEANDLAMRLARCHTKHEDMITLEGAYHGHLTGTIDISPYKFKHMADYKQKESVHVAPIPCSYRGMYTTDEYKPERVGELYAGEVQKLIESASKSDRKIAGFIHESMISCGGQVVLPPTYLKHVYNFVRSAGGVCIADEVQVGFGRVGDKMWAFETQGDDICPDIVTIGKPIGNGHPVAAVVTTQEIADSFQAIGTEYFNTYGGNPVSIAIASAVLDVIEKENLRDNAISVGGYMIGELQKYKKHYEIIGDVRGQGMFFGVDIVESKESKKPAPEVAEYIVAKFKEQNILMSTEGIYGNVLKFKPPMCFSMENAKNWMSVYKTIMDEITNCNKIPQYSSSDDSSLSSSDEAYSSGN